MHQILFRLGLRPRPRWGDYSAFPEPLKGGRPTSKGDGRRKRRERIEEGRGREGTGRNPPPPFE